MSQSTTRMGNAVAFRILKCCLFGNSHVARALKGGASSFLDETSSRLYIAVIVGCRKFAEVSKNLHALVLLSPILADHALPWLIRAIDCIQVSSNSTSEYFGSICSAAIVRSSGDSIGQRCRACWEERCNAMGQWRVLLY
jgi:hypothetical protein